MTWTAERIPIWVPPVPGEALDSWMEAYARRLAVPAAGFLDLIGLPKAKPQLMVRRLTPGECRVLSLRTGVAPDRLVQMTLEPWDGLVVTIGEGNRQMLRPPAWRRYGSETRYCPACLGEGQGRWPLTWRLPWSFACTHHNLLLRDLCPACGRPPRIHSPHRNRPSTPGTCLAGMGKGTGMRCGAPLVQAATASPPRDGLILSAQRQVNETLLGSDVRMETAQSRARELYRLARRALKNTHGDLASAPTAIHDILTEAGGRLPEFDNLHQGNDPVSTAIGTAAACVILDTGHPSSEEVFAWLLATDLAAWSRPAVISWLQDAWLPISPRMAARAATRMDSALPLRTRVRHGTTTGSPVWSSLTDDDVRRRASRIPAMLWPSWTLRLLPATTPAPHRLAGFRRFCATLMLLHGSLYDQQQAAALLNIARPRAQRRAFDEAVADSDLHALITTLVRLAQVLDNEPSPIDYGRRRELFRDTTLTFDQRYYEQLCHQHGLHATARYTKYMRWHVLKLLLSGNPGDATCTPVGPAKFRHRLPSDLTAFLVQQAAANLAAHGITEPIQWEPSAHCIDDLAAPGIAAEATSPDSLTAVGTKQDAHATGIGKAHLELIEEATVLSSLSHPQPPKARLPWHFVPRRGALAPDELRRLYQEQGLDQKPIAALAGCSTGAVRNALRDAKIPLRERRAPRSLEQTISQDWLQAEYTTKGRSSPDIARELGVHPNDVLKLMRKWAIPRDSHRSNPFASAEAALSPAMKRVCATGNSLQRLRHVTEIPGHRTLTAAADTLRVAVSVLSHQLQGIEIATGFTVIARTRPLTATPAGQEFLSEAKRLLKILNQPEP